MLHTAKQAVAQRGMLAGIETKWKGALVLLVNGTWKRELFSMTVEKRLRTGSWRVVRSLIQLLMVMEIVLLTLAASGGVTDLYPS